MTAYRISPDPILNAFIDGDAICLVRRVNGQRTIEHVECSYAAFWKRSDLRDGNGKVTPLGRALLASGARLEACGTESPIWIRGGWARDEGRKWMDPSLRAASHEADVDPIRRWFIDTGCRVASPRRAYFDLETDSRVPFNLKERARILSWAVVSESGRSWSAVIQEDSDLAEAELLVAFWSVVTSFDQLLAWNGDNFDFPVIRARTARLAAMDTSADDPSLDPADADSPFATLANVDPRIWLWLDHLAVYDRMNTAESGDEKTSLKLNSVAQALLGEKKHDFDASKTWQEWESPHLPPTERAESRARLLAYCVQDTVLLKKIEDKTGFIRLFQTLCEACNVLPDSKGLNPTQQVDGFLLKLADERGHHFPTRQYAKSVEKFRGAYVMQPTGKGIVKDCHVADFASLYPSIILSWNMSPETKVITVGRGDQPRNVAPSNAPFDTNASSTAPTALAPTGTRFRTDVPGILPIALDELLRLRKDWNDRKSALPPGTPEWYDADRRSTAYKVAANSFYGVMGSPYSRYFDKDVGEAVTQSGVWLIKTTQAEAEKRGMSVIYADTDSIFVVGQGESLAKDDFTAFVDWCNKELYPRILPEQGCTVNRIKLAYEKQFARIVFTSAKRYCGTYSHYKGKLATANSKPEIKGLEYKRGDAALLARRLQSEVINLFVSGCENPRDYQAIVERHKGHVLYEDLPIEEVQLSKTLSKAIDEYTVKRKGKGADTGKTVIVPNPLAHVKIARQMRDKGEEVGVGTRIGYVVRDGSKRIEPIHVSDFDGSNADRYYLWERLVFPPTLRLLAAMFPNEKWDQHRKVPRVSPNQMTLFPR